MIATHPPLPSSDDLDEVRRKMKDLRSLIDPEWRYTRARELKSEHIIHFRRTEDPWVIRLAQFLLAWDKAGVNDIAEVEDRFPDVAWAYKIYINEARGPRYHLEALIVANQDIDEVANYLNLPMPIILAYETCFFDLRSHLEKYGAIRTFITSRARSRGLRDLDPDPFWKRIAIDEGVDLLLVLWSDGRMEEADQRKYDELISASMRRNALEAQKVREVSSINAGDVMLEYAAVRRVEQDEKRAEFDAGAVGGMGIEFVANLLHSVQFTVAAVGPETELNYVELTTAVLQAPKLLERLQGAAAEKDDVTIPETSD